MVQVMRKIKIKIRSDTPDNFVPANMTKKDWYPVIFATTNEWKENRNDKTEYRYSVKFFVINDKMELIRVSSKNCIVSLSDAQS